VRHGISRALVDYDEALKPALRKAGLVTRDARRSSARKLVCTRRAGASNFPSARRIAFHAKAASGRLFCLVRPAGRTHLEVEVLYSLGKEKS